jgi:hypothetical protein
VRAPVAALVIVVALLSGGCARKLPGPLECRAFALGSMGLHPETPATLLARNPGLTARAEQLTQTCLTKPWDYQLLGCLQHSRSEQLCLLRFEQRRAVRAAPDDGFE